MVTSAKQTVEHLRYLQSMPLDIKIKLTQQRIREWVRVFGENGVYVSFSGGKDSTVLLDIVRGLYPGVPAVFVDTGLEYPEIRKFVKSVDNVIWLKPSMPFNEVINKYGYPVFSKETAYNIEYGRSALKRGDQRSVDRHFYGVRVKDNETYTFNPLSRKALDVALNTDIKVSEKCCRVMKKAPVKSFEKETDRKPFIATMTEESKVRETVWLQNGCNAFDNKRQVSTPMSFWTEQDVLRYIYTRSLRYANEVYGDITSDCGGLLKTTGVSRTGCMFCMFGVHREPHPNRFERMKHTHPRQWDYCINKLGCGAVLDYIGVAYGKEEEAE